MCACGGRRPRADGLAGGEAEVLVAPAGPPRRQRCFGRSAAWPSVCRTRRHARALVLPSFLCIVQLWQCSQARKEFAQPGICIRVLADSSQGKAPAAAGQAGQAAGQGKPSASEGILIAEVSSNKWRRGNAPHGREVPCAAALGQQRSSDTRLTSLLGPAAGCSAELPAALVGQVLARAAGPCYRRTLDVHVLRFSQPASYMQ